MYTVITLAGLIGAAFWLVLTLQCQPIRKFWHPSEPGGCLQVRYILAMAYLYSGSACLCDLTLGLFPIYLLKDLHVHRGTKLAAMAILSMGCLYVHTTRRTVLTKCFCSSGAAVVARIPYIHEMPGTKGAGFLCK
jgi:hypothetical protein